MIIIIAITVCLWWGVVPHLFCKPSKSAGLEIVDLPALSSYFTNPPVVLPPAACLPAGLLQLQLLGNENIAVLSNGISSARTVASTMSVCLRGKTHCEH
jgi:hypothetical protein